MSIFNAYIREARQLFVHLIVLIGSFFDDDQSYATAEYLFPRLDLVVRLQDGLHSKLNGCSSVSQALHG